MKKLHVSTTPVMMFIYSVWLVMACPNAFAETKTFDDLTAGDYDQSFVYGDMTVNTFVPTATLAVTDATSDGYGKAYSLQNKLSVRGSEPLTTEQTSMKINFLNPVENFNFWLTGSFHDTTVTAYDSTNTLKETFVQTYPTTGSTAPDGRPWDYYYDDQLRFIEFNYSGISSVLIQPNAHDGFSIDNVSYTVTPEPATMALFGLGAGALAFARKRKKLGQQIRK